MTSIPLSSILPIANPRDFKVHLAGWNQIEQPLDVFVRNRIEWDAWNSWRSDKDQFNRDYILSMIDFHLQPGLWLFGGIYRVVARSPLSRQHSYVVERVPEFEALVGRLKIAFARSGRARSIRLENFYDRMTIAELLREPYSGEAFPGYENINHGFRALEAVIQAQRQDWKAALSNVKGVYLIADLSNGKKYVGSAYGDAGIWSRWSCYIGTGHGWNDELTKLIDREGLDYARNNFRISLLEYRPARTDDATIMEREAFWKEALLSRVPHGYNRN